MVTVLCVVLFLASLGATRVWCRRSLFNPLIAFFGIWMLNLALYEVDNWLQVFNVRLSDFADSMLSLSLICVFLGTCIGIMAGLFGTREECLEVDSRVLDRMQGTAVLLFVVFVVGVAWRYAVTVSTYGLLLENLPEIREGTHLGDLSVPTASRLMTLAGYMVILNLAVVSVLRPRLVFLLLIVAAVSLNFVSDLTVGARGSTFNAVLLMMTTVLIALRARHGRTRVSHILAGASIGFTAVLLMTAMLYLRSDKTLTFVERFLIDNYVYAVGPVPALTYYLEAPWPSDVPGQWTFAGIYQAVDGLLGIVGGGRILTPETFQTYYAPITDIGPFNVASHVVYFYSDLGEVGVALFSGVMGLVAGYTFVRAVRVKRITEIQIAGLLMFLVIFSVRGVVTNGIMFWVCLAFITVQHFALAHRAPNRRSGIVHAGEVGARVG